MTTALIIAGHGSHLSPQTAAPAWQHADAIRRMGIFDEVTCAFWKEAPSLRRVLDTLTADDVTIVPLFTSQGYFSRTVLPSELGLDGPLTRRAGRLIRYTDTVGQHPHMTSVVLDRANAVLNLYDLDPAQTALALAGHGTRRDPGSAAATRFQADAVRASGRFEEVVAIYMDEPPEIESAYQITHSPSIIVVPFFVADGSHTQEDIPVDLRLSADPRHNGYQVPTRVDGRDVYYTSAVGMEPSVVNVILDLARDAGAPLREPHPIANPWTGFPKAEIGHLNDVHFPLDYGQVRVESSGSVYVITRAGEAESLTEVMTPKALRDLLSRDADGNFRALRTQTDLPGGWRVTVHDHDSLLAALETIYPAAWIDVVDYRAETLPVQNVGQVIERQTGMYKRVGSLPDDLLSVLVQAHCGSCVRYPLWFDSPADPLSGHQLPCAEPCQCWMSFALQQIEARREAPIAVNLSPAEIASLCAALESAIKRHDPDVRPAEYEDPRNLARLRALLAQLNSNFI